MASTPETGYLLIADLTGYTAYLASGEIEHAPTIAGDLLETVVGRLEPPFRLAKLEGDAAFLFVEDGRAEPSLLFDALVAAYLAFRRRLRSIEQATSCNCNACSRAPRLDLKFFLHHGQYVRSLIAGRSELAGSSIIVVHRLLKGTAALAAHAADGRASGFAVLTADAAAALAIEPAAHGATEGVEEIEHLGRVVTHTVDLEARWASETGERRLNIEPGRALLDVEISVPASPASVWAHLTAPALRPSWEGPIVISELVVDGHRGVGTQTQCVTGRLATLEEIVDWQPLDHVGYRLAVPEVGPVVATYDLESVDGGTRAQLRWAAADLSATSGPSFARFRRTKRASVRRLARLLHVASTEEVSAP